MSAQPAPGNTTFWDVPSAPPDAAWIAKRKLAAQLRALAALCVTSDAPETTLAYASDAVERVAERLAQHPTRTFLQGIATCKTPEELARFADRATLTGLCNPIAPPMELSMDGERAIGVVTFGPSYEGIPGHVHGGLVAAVFDQLFGYLQVKLGKGAVTGELTVRYLAPTPLMTPLRLEGELLKTEGRRSTVAAKMYAGTNVTAEAEAIFVRLQPGRLQGIIDSASRG